MRRIQLLAAAALSLTCFCWARVACGQTPSLDSLNVMAKIGKPEALPRKTLNIVYKTVDGVVTQARMAPDKSAALGGKTVVAVSLLNDADGAHLSYFWVYKDEACCVDSTIQKGVSAASIIQACNSQRLRARLYLNPDGSCAGVHLFGYTPVRKTTLMSPPEEQARGVPIAQPPFYVQPWQSFGGSAACFGSS